MIPILIQLLLPKFDLCMAVFKAVATDVSKGIYFSSSTISSSFRFLLLSSCFFSVLSFSFSSFTFTYSFSSSRCAKHRGCF